MCVCVFVCAFIESKHSLGSWCVPATAAGIEERAVGQDQRALPSEGRSSRRGDPGAAGAVSVVRACASVDKGPIWEQGQVQTSTCACELECVPLGVLLGPLGSGLGS